MVLGRITTGVISAERKLKYTIKRDLSGDVVFGRSSGVGTMDVSTSSVGGNTRTQQMNGGNWVDVPYIIASMKLYNSQATSVVMGGTGKAKAFANSALIGSKQIILNMTVGSSTTFSDDTSIEPAPLEIQNGTFPNVFTLSAFLSSTTGPGTVYMGALIPDVPVLNELESVWI